MESGQVPLVDLGPVQYQSVRSPSGYMNCTANQHQLPVNESRSEHVQAEGTIMESGQVPLVDLGPVQYQNVRSPSGYMNCTANQHQLPVNESRSEHVEAGQTQLYYNTVYQGQMQPSNVYSNQGQMMMQNPNAGSVNYPPQIYCTPVQMQWQQPQPQLIRNTVRDNVRMMPYTRQNTRTRHDPVSVSTKNRFEILQSDETAGAEDNMSDIGDTVNCAVAEGIISDEDFPKLGQNPSTSAVFKRRRTENIPPLPSPTVTEQVSSRVRTVGEMDIPEKELNSECVIFTPVEEDQTFPNDMILLRILKGVVPTEDLEFVCNKERRKLSVHMKKSETKGKLLATTKLGKIDVITAHAYITTITARSSQTMVPVEKVEQMKKDAVQTALEAVTAALVIKPDLINITNLTVDQSVLKICTALEFITGWKQQDQDSEPSSPRFSIQKANWSEFDEALKSMEIDKMLVLAEEVDQKIEIFQGKLLEAAEKTIPKNKHNLKGQKSTPWWNEDCEEAKKELKKRRHEYDRIPTLDRYIKVKQAHARFRKKVKEAKRHSWHTFVENLDFRESSTKVYRFIKRMNTRNQAREDNPPIVVNGEMLVDNIDKANAGAEYLKNVIGRQDPFKDDCNRTIWKVKKVSQKKRMEDYNRPFTEREVNEVVKNLPNTTPGDDLIYPEFVKRLPEIWMKELLKIINIAWKSGYFPKIWKKGTAIMIPKPGKDSEKIENFRFITLLPVLGKVYERLVKNRLSWLTEEKKGLKDYQCGFRRNRSTLENLILLQRDALYVLQNSKIMIVVFLDVRGAFDNLVHRKMLEGMMAMGLVGNIVQFGMSYLTEQMLSVCNPRRLPPWEVDKLVCENNFEERKAIVPAFSAMKAEKYHGYLEIYTDGSKTENEVGAAFVIPKSRIAEKYKLHPRTSIFQAELLAVNKAAEHLIQHRYGCNAFLICTDSKSVVSALKNIHAKNITREVLITYETISKLIDEGSSVVLHWIPGHRGIEGNEAADQEAKDALANGTSVEEFAPTVINNIRSAMQQMRVARAQHIQDVTGNMFALKKTKLQPTKIYSKLSRKQIRIIFRLRSGHAGYGVFKARMFGEDGNCSICSVPETREHLLLRCPAHEQQRLEVKRYCRTRNIRLTVETMLGECENIEDSVEMCKLTCSYVSKIKSVI
ncbi:hypothetical protein QYM36_005901 [Artemia franciscana]|uniref:RNase H type-1 domain-containing protein n=1 Tax=Artemia franciscana TaxID=6661 RepID=A0AA88L4P4_ARTSF|nr:hypothetical protein QYM36_005901 [Artemia franciscana]